MSTKQVLSLKQCLKQKVPTIGSWLSLGSPEVAEIMARCGFDWLVVDMEHSATTPYQAQQLIRTVELNGCVPLVRVAENNPTYIKQAMDAGAHGVIVPMVNTPDAAIAAVNAVKYSPVGTRGTGLWRAQGYGMSFDEYVEWLHRESVVIVQIEHIEAVRTLEEILAVDGVDGFIVGPYDLSASLGVPGEFFHPDVIAALNSIDMSIQRGVGAAAGFHIVHPDKDLLFEKLDAGYTFLAYSVDMIYLWTAITESLQAIWQKIPKR